jgi:GT2 family glycosyltransferase
VTALKPLVDVVIVNFNGGDYLRRAVAALQAQSFRDFRIIVIDNASTDDSVVGLPSEPIELLVVKSARNLGFAAANNLAINGHVSAEWVALVNPDAFVRHDWLDRMYQAALSAEGYQFFGCLMLDASNPNRIDGVGDAYHVSGMHWRDGHGCARDPTYEDPQEIFGPCAAAALYRTDDIRHVGGFDEDFFCYAEDIDLAFRLRLNGRRCAYVPDAVVEHVGSGIVGVRSDFAVYHGHRNLVWAYVKNMPGWLFWAYLPHHIVLNVATLVLFTLMGRWVMWRAKRDALIGLPDMFRKRRKIQAGRRVPPSALRAVMRGGLPNKSCRR